jgi:reactive intermediate/imine deaminase
MRRAVAGVDLPVVAGAYSPGVTAGELVFVSGQAPIDADGRIVTGDFVTQARVAFGNLAAILSAAGIGLSDVQRLGVYLADLGDFAELNELMIELFEAPLPARTTVPVDLPGFLIEVDAIAVRPRG